MELVYRFAVVSYCAARYAGLPALAAAAAMLLARRRRAALRVEWLALLGACALLCAYALVGSPQISDRSFTAVIVLVLAAALAAYADMSHGRRSAAALAVLALACALGSWQAIGDVSAHEAAWNAQLAYAGEAKAAGQTRVQIESVPSDSRFTMSIILEKDASLWPNSTLSKALGIDIYSE